MFNVDGIIRIDIGVGTLPCDNVHAGTIWLRGILQWVNANIKCVAQALAVNLVCLDSTLSFFLMTSVLDIEFSVVQRWELDHLGGLVPRTVPSGTLSAPPDILQLILCNYKASGCRTAARSCTKIGCTIFCLCEGAEACKNPLTRSQTEDESEKTIDDPDDDDM